MTRAGESLHRLLKFPMQPTSGQHMHLAARQRNAENILRSQARTGSFMPVILHPFCAGNK